MKNASEIVFILDGSGSMYPQRKEAVDSFNALLRGHQNRGEDALVTTVVFADDLTVLHSRQPIEDLYPLSYADFQPGGCTALLDAMGTAISYVALSRRFEKPMDRPGRVMFFIYTDGMENASKKFDTHRVREMIRVQKQAGWEFHFLCSDVEALRSAEELQCTYRIPMSRIKDAMAHFDRAMSR